MGYSSGPNRSATAARGWYGTRRWRDLKQAVHVRDAYTCRRCGRICGGAFPEDDSPVADHIKAHRGDERLFWDASNVQTLCKAPCHDQVKQAEEQASLNERGNWY